MFYFFNKVRTRNQLQDLTVGFNIFYPINLKYSSVAVVLCDRRHNIKLLMLQRLMQNTNFRQTECCKEGPNSKVSLELALKKRETVQLLKDKITKSSS